MNAKRLRELYIDFFVNEYGHTLIGSAPLIPERDPSVLFVPAGMHPLIPYLLGESHPAGTRLVSCQKCVRTGDIEEVGDNTHLTFFEMLGNWSLNDYWKAESLGMSYQFLTEKLGLEPDRLYVTCFVGDADAPRDLEAAEIWRLVGLPADHIVFLPKGDNWWGPAGASGPCGPDSEIFYDMQPDGTRGETPATHPKRFREVWNNVFMEYEKRADGSYVPLAQRNIDTGMGLERTLAALGGHISVYETELFTPIIDHIMTLAAQPNEHTVRVIADHIRAAVFILAEGITPGNVDQPYIARRLIRRAVRYGHEIAIRDPQNKPFLPELAQTVIATLDDVYPELTTQRDHILSALEQEELRFGQTLVKGQQAFFNAMQTQAGKVFSGDAVFRLYDTYGFPPELTAELAGQHGLTADMAGYRAAFEAHQALSRQGAEARFKGGLSERSPQTTRLHTATHLLHQALRQVLGEQVEQRGSNITVERLRFDFNHITRLTPEQVERVEAIVNAQIQRDLPVSWEELSLEAAKISGAIGLFEDRYSERVKVYRMGDFSAEICGGPHVESTGELGRFKIVKEEAVASGVRRIRAVLEQ